MVQPDIPLPALQSYTARDGNELYLRYYPAQSETVCILLHGISEDSKYLYPLASFLSSNDLAHVITPDLRGYGETPIRRGDVDYIGQIEDDLVDLMKWVKAVRPNASIILAGHSAGGGTVIRFAGNKQADLVEAYLLLAPALGPGAPTEKPSNGMVQINTKRVVTLVLLNALRIRSWNHLPVLKINRPEAFRHGDETLELSFRLVVSRSPMKYKKDLRKLTKPTLVLVGSSDEVFDAGQYEPVFATNTTAKVQIIPNESHDGILSNVETHGCVKTWLESVSGAREWSFTSGCAPLAQPGRTDC